MKINCFIIDDEPASQNILKKYISDVEFLNLAGAFGNAIDAMKALKTNQNIGLLFLDINMPKISGLTFYKSLQNPPDVIFTTAYPQYAVEGFDLNAIDYLLKPFSFDRFFTAVNKVVNKKRDRNSQLKEESFLLVKAGKILHKIATENILYIEAYGDYVKVHIADKFILTNNTFTTILESLPQSKFIRAHKSFAINLDKIKTIEGNQINVDEHLIPIGQKYKSNFLNALKYI